MITIVEPQKYISDLWAGSKIKLDESYRLMQYVIRTDCQDGVLLHNVVTGQLVLLDQEEARLLEKIRDITFAWNDF